MKTSGAKNAHAGEGSVRAFRKKRMLEVVPDASAEVAGERASGSGVLVFSIAVFLVSLCVVMGLSSLLLGKWDLLSLSVLLRWRCLRRCRPTSLSNGSAWWFSD